MKTKELLRALGLSTYEALVYEALLKVGKAKVQDLARMTSVPRPQIYVALGKLLDKGMCSEDRGKVSHYAAVAPDLAFRESLTREQRQLEAKAESVKKLAELHARPEKQDVPEDFVRVLKGGQIRELMDTLAREVQSEVLTFFKAAQEQTEASLEGAVKLEESILGRGVRIRCIYEAASLENRQIAPILRRLARAGEQGRVVESVPMNMSAFDDRAVLFTLTTEKGDVTVFAFTHPALVATMKAGFEFLWQQGRGLKAELRKLKSQ